MAWKAFFSTWVGRAGLQGRAGPPDPAHPVYPFPALACGWGQGAGEEHAGLRFYKAEVSSSCSTGLPAGGRGGRPRQEPLLLGGGAGLLPPTQGAAQSACPSKPQGPAGLASSSPHDQLRVCGANSAPTRARLNHGARGVGTFAGHVATGSDPKHRATWLQLTCPVGNSCEKLVQSAPSTGFHQCPAIGNTPHGHLPLETVKRPWPR